MANCVVDIGFWICRYEGRLASCIGDSGLRTEDKRFTILSRRQRSWFFSRRMYPHVSPPSDESIRHDIDSIEIHIPMGLWNAIEISPDDMIWGQACDYEHQQCCCNSQSLCLRPETRHLWWRRQYILRPERWESEDFRPFWDHLTFCGGPRVCTGQLYCWVLVIWSHAQGALQEKLA